MLVVTFNVNLALRYAAQHNSGLEVGGFGRTQVTEAGDIICNEVYIPPQVVQSGHTDIKGPDEPGGEEMFEDFFRYIATHCAVCRKEVGDDHARERHDFEGESWSDWRLWWHSHGRLGTTPSGTDHNTLGMIARNLNDGWAVGLVIDSAGGRHAWVNQAFPFRLDREIDFGSYPYEDEDIKGRIEAMMERVEEKKWQQSGYGGPHSGNASQPSQVGAISTTKPGTISRLPRRAGSNKKLLEMNEEEWKEFIREHSTPLNA